MNTRNITINPLNMSTEQKTILNHYLKSLPDKKYLLETPAFEYEVSVENSQDSNTLINFALTHSLFLRPCSGKSKRPHYEVFSFKNKLDFGTFSLIFVDKGRLDEELNFKPKDYLIKLQQGKIVENYNDTDFTNLPIDSSFYSKLDELFKKIDNEKRLLEIRPLSLKRIKDELYFMNQAGIRTKDPIVLKTDEHYGYTLTIMEKIPGSSLFDVLRESIDKGNDISTNLRIDLILELLRALDTQVHAKGIVHRDIKPENILVDIDHDREEVKVVRYIDFNLSKKACDKTFDAVGTDLYISPEASVGKNTDYSSDIYSLGKVLTLILGEKKHLEDLNEEDYKSLQELFANMTMAFSEQRITLAKAIEKVEKLKQQRECSARDSFKQYDSSNMAPMRFFGQINTTANTKRFEPCRAFFKF